MDFPLGAVWSASALFAQTCLSENLGILRYFLYARFLSDENDPGRAQSTCFTFLFLAN